MENCLRVSIIGLFITMVSCNPRGDFDIQRYQKAVRDGFTKIPEACEIEELLGQADHFISYQGSTPVWNTEVYFGGRYSLTMQVIVKVDKEFGKILEVVGEPKFYLVETERVVQQGAVFAAYAADDFKFGLSEWRKVVAAKGDFSAIGIHLKRNQPVANFDRFVEGMRRPRIQVRPECTGADTLQPQSGSPPGGVQRGRSAERKGPFIEGGSDEMYTNGRLTTLRVGSPDEQVVVVVLYPQPIDRSWEPGVGHSGNGDDTSTWEEQFQVRIPNGRRLEDTYGKMAVFRSHTSGKRRRCDVRFAKGQNGRRSL